MGDMWRSQKMQLVQLIVQNDAAHAVINKLGQVGIVEFRDVSARPGRARLASNPAGDVDLWYF